MHWPVLFGTRVVPIGAFLVESNISQGTAWSGLVLAVAFAVMVASIAANGGRIRREWIRCRFPLYLIIVGAMSAFVYAVGRCGEIAIGTMRYDLLSIVGAVGITALFLTTVRAQALRAVAMALILSWAAVSTSAHVRLWINVSSRADVPDKVLIIRSLEARGIRYAMADYWIAYYTTFMTNERVIVAADDIGRIPVYEQEVLAHRAEAVRIARTPCGDQRPVIEGVYFCPLE